jgi:hypothetical protein
LTAVTGFIVGAASVTTTLAAVSLTSRTILRRVTIAVTAGYSRGYAHVYPDRTTIVAAIVGATDQTRLTIVIAVTIALTRGTRTIGMTEIFITMAAHAFFRSRYGMDANIDTRPAAELGSVIESAESTGNTIGLTVAISFSVHTGTFLGAIILITDVARMTAITTITGTRRTGLARIANIVAAGTRTITGTVQTGLTPTRIIVTGSVPTAVPAIY